MDVQEFLVKIINRQITAEPEDVALLFYFMIPVRINVSVTIALSRADRAAAARSFISSAAGHERDHERRRHVWIFYVMSL